MTIVRRLTRNSVSIGEVFLPRPAYVTGNEWVAFWADSEGRHPVDFDHFRAIAFGAAIPRPASVTSLEWERFWVLRTTKSPGLTQSDNHEADRRWPWRR